MDGSLNLYLLKAFMLGLCIPPDGVLYCHDLEEPCPLSHKQTPANPEVLQMVTTINDTLNCSLFFCRPPITIYISMCPNVIYVLCFKRYFTYTLKPFNFFF